MPKSQVTRFASGTPDAPFSGVWRIVIQKSDVFIGVSRKGMGIFKISLHESGVWTLAATEQSRATFEEGNRRAIRWKRPPEHAHGITRGPSIFVPHTSLGSRRISVKELEKKIFWYKAPSINEVVEFSLYYVARGAVTQWNSTETVLADSILPNGSKVALLASVRPSTPEFSATVEKLLKENVFLVSAPSDVMDDSFLWFTDSRDHLNVPVVVDLPVPIHMKKD